jgi:hypothetical protein
MTRLETHAQRVRRIMHEQNVDRRVAERVAGETEAFTAKLLDELNGLQEVMLRLGSEMPDEQFDRWNLLALAAQRRGVRQRSCSHWTDDPDHACSPTLDNGGTVH